MVMKSKQSGLRVRTSGAKKNRPLPVEPVIVLSQLDAYMFLVSAIRYALGLYPDPEDKKNRARRTHIVGWARNQVRAIAPKLMPFQRAVLIRDIRDCEDYGGDYDRQDWLSLLEWLEKMPYDKDVAPDSRP